MELLLTHQDEDTVTVTCDGHLSHHFQLTALTIPKEREEEQIQQDPIGYGKRIYEALFAPETLARHALDSIPERILLVSTSDDLDEIAWEYCYGPDGFLIQDYPFVRGLPAEQRIQTPTLSTGLHIIAIPSNPLSSQLAPLNIEGEWSRLRDVISDLTSEVTLERMIRPTIQQLRNVVANQQQRVIHFIGHGGQGPQDAMLYFEQDSGELDPINAKDLVRRIRSTTLLVTLNACLSAAPGHTDFSNMAATLVRYRIPYALGMRQEIADEDALLFSRTFYADLARGSSVEEALRQARLTLADTSPRPWVVGVPVLYTALETSTPGFMKREGTPIIIEQYAPKEVATLPRAEGIFQGRANDLIHIGKQLTGDQRPRILTIHGGGGQGKTALAREVVERFAHAWPGGVWAISLEHLPERAFVAADLARFLGINPQEIADASELERQIAARLTSKRTLIVIDNAETLVDAVEAQNPQAFPLVEFLQHLPTRSVSLLVTSRIVLGWPGEEVHELQGLSEMEGAKLFCQSASTRQEARDLTLARDLSQKVAGHPLSLRLLAGAFQGSSLPLATFVQQCETHLRQTENKYVGQEHRHRSLYACLDISIHYLNASLRDLLSGLWIFQAPFLADTAVAIFDPDLEETEDFRSAIRDQLHHLWLRGLLTRSIIPTSDGLLHFYAVLPTTRSYLEYHLPQHIDRLELEQRFGQAYLHLVKFVYDELNRSPAVFALVQQIAGDLEQAWSYPHDEEQAAYKIIWGWILMRLGLPQHAIKLLENSLEHVQGHHLSLTLHALNNLATVYDGIGQPQRALSMHETALSTMRIAGDREEETTTLSNMAGIYARIGQPQRALSLYKEALPLRREISDRDGEATILSNMAGVYGEIGQPQRALRLYKEALPLMQAEGNQAGEAAILNNMGVVHQNMRNSEQALQLYEKALPLRRGIGDRVGEAGTLSNMAAIYDGIGQPQQALHLYEKALPLVRAARNRAGEATVLNNMGAVYRGMKEPQKALHLYEEALILTRIVGDRYGEATTLNNIAVVYQEVRQPHRALQLYEEALPLIRAVEYRAGEATTLNNMAMVYQGIRKSQLALQLYEVALPLRREVGDWAGEVATLHNIAVLQHTAFHNIEAALSSVEQALKILAQTDLSQDAAGHTAEDLKRLSQRIRQGDPLTEFTIAIKGLPDEELQPLIMGTIVVMTRKPEYRDEWKHALSELLHEAEQRGLSSSIDVDFFRALLALLDGQLVTLPDNHPYALSLQQIQDGIAARDAHTQEEINFPELLVSHTIAVFGPQPEMRVQWRDVLVQLKLKLAKELPNSGLSALFDALIALLDANGNPTGIETHLEGEEALVWQEVLLYLSTQKGS